MKRNAYGPTLSICTQNLSAATKAARELCFCEARVDRELVKPMPGCRAGRRKSGSGGAQGKHGLPHVAAPLGPGSGVGRLQQRTRQHRAQREQRDITINNAQP